MMDTQPAQGARHKDMQRLLTVENIRTEIEKLRILANQADLDFLEHILQAVLLETDSLLDQENGKRT